VASGDFLVPRLAGLPYLDKPPGYFWAASLPIGLLGHTPLAARLPTIVSTLILLLVLARASVRLAPDGHAVRMLALLASAPLFMGLSAYCIFDMLLAACVTVLWTLLALEVERGPKTLGRVAMFAAVAAGLLVKGPVMLAWAIGGSLAAALVLRGLAPLAWLGWWPGWLLVAATAGGWFWLALQRHPEYLRYAFVEESLERLTRASFAREQPFWFVPAVLACGALPWSVATPWGRARTGPEKVATGFVLFAALFFMVSRSKLVTYLLPAMPALAWWATGCWMRASRNRVRISGVVLNLVVMAALTFVMLHLRTRLDRDDPANAAAWLLLVLLLVLLPLTLAVAFLGARQLALAVCVASTVLAFAAGTPALMDYAEAWSGAGLARAIARLDAPEHVYEQCYSPGTDYLLGRGGRVLSEGGHELSSNYVVRHRETLVRRGWWPLQPPGTPVGDASIRVRPAARWMEGPPPGWDHIFRDRRFVAYRRLDVVH
jgi:4-amino-4-deoxy-L-arabinose transferase-like glycosyltransferase